LNQLNGSEIIVLLDMAPGVGFMKASLASKKWRNKAATARTFALLSAALLIGLLGLCLPAPAALYTKSPAQESLIKDGKLHIFLIGTGDPEVEMQEIRGPACVAVLVDGNFFLIDAGEGSIQKIAGLGLPYQLIQRAFITHWHADHFAGLGQVINASWVHGRKQPFVVYGPYGVHKVVAGLNQAYELESLFKASTLNGLLDLSLSLGVPSEVPSGKDASEVYACQDLKITAFTVDHAPVVPALGYTIEYRGCKVVVSGDTRVTGALEKQAQGAVVLISEVFSHPLSQVEIERDQKSGNLAAARFTADVSRYHADSLDLAKMAQRAGVKRLILTHLVPSIPVTAEAKQAFTAGMSDYFPGEITVSADGDQIVIAPGGGTFTVEYLPGIGPDKQAVLIK
jgi:ribonuclease Z